MTRTQVSSGLLHRLEEVRQLCPDMRLGQLVAAISMLAEDTTGRGIWDIEDDEFAAALERFAADLARRHAASDRRAQKNGPRPL